MFSVKMLKYFARNIPLSVYVHDASGARHLAWQEDGLDPHDSPYVSLTSTVSCFTMLDWKDVGSFHLFFSFHPFSKLPWRLRGGFFNCSVDFYVRFQQHLDCNLRTDCADGRDETEHCPFSSADCQGRLALCSRCYKIVRVDTLSSLNTTEISTYNRASDYCRFLGGTLVRPICLYNWYGAIQNCTKPYVYTWGTFWTGLVFGHTLSPNMYKRNVVSEDRTVLYHSVPFEDTSHSGRDMCVFDSRQSYMYPCHYRTFQLPAKAICEFRKNEGVVNSDVTNAIELHDSAFVTLRAVYSLIMCLNGQVTHTFLLCGSQSVVCGAQYTSCAFLNHTAYTHSASDIKDQGDFVVPMFRCDGIITTFSYSLVCDFRPDCRDQSDENFCRHPPCVRMFTCSNGQCVFFDNVCDQLFQCQDKSDEKDCLQDRIQTTTLSYFPSPGLIHFDCVSMFTFTSTPMKVNESCPDTHYRCPGKFNDCLPVYTRCNDMYDCLDHEDEEGCDDVTCEGLFRCRASRLCVHGDHLCDGWPQCPQEDDEMLCDTPCPLPCLCQGHTFLCFQTFSASHFPLIRSLNATGSGMTLTDVNSLHFLVDLILAECSLSLIPDMRLLNLKFLDLSRNKLQHVNVTRFVRLENLETLSLSHNPLVSFHVDLSSAAFHSRLRLLDLSVTTLTVFESKVFSKFVNLLKMNLTFTSIHTVSSDGFRFIPRLTELYTEGSPFQTFTANLFQDLYRLRVISTDNYRLCCSEILPVNFDDDFCFSPRDDISSCEDLLQSGTYRVFLWLTCCMCIMGNVFCLAVRLSAKGVVSSMAFNVLVTNLTMSDFLMGVYLAVIGTADELFRGKYLYNGHTWKDSAPCRLAGLMALLSSEVSALIIWLITIDRFAVLCFPFSTVRFERKSASIACLLTWLVGLFLVSLPLFPMTRHWEFYSRTEICIPLPVSSRQEFKGSVYSLSIMIVFNFVLFAMIAVGQVFIYISVQKNTLETVTAKVSQNITIARRLFTVAATDFMCWFPIGLCGFLAAGGIPIPVEVSVALAIFALPLNSVLNPFLYTVNTFTEKRRKSNEAKLLKWMESQPDLILNC